MDPPWGVSFPRDWIWKYWNGKYLDPKERVYTSALRFPKTKFTTKTIIKIEILFTIFCNCLGNMFYRHLVFSHLKYNYMSLFAVPMPAWKIKIMCETEKRILFKLQIDARWSIFYMNIKEIHTYIMSDVFL